MATGVDDRRAQGRSKRSKPRGPAKRRKQVASPSLDASAPAPAQRRWRRWLRRALLAIALVAALPFGLIALYAVPAIEPRSTLMLTDALLGRESVREWRDLDEMPDALIASVLASEDGQFCSHRGVDWGAVAEVARNAMEGERTRGASTVTMQTVKNLFLPPTRSFLRKAFEVPLASFADLVWGKRRTLEIYLNIAEWAPAHYGAAAGASFWFGKDLSRLTRNEAARMAVTLPNPYIRNPADPGPRTAALARLNAKRARGMGPYLGCLQP